MRSRRTWIPHVLLVPCPCLSDPRLASDGNANVNRQQYLEEDPRTNRIDDSLQLFTTICANKLLGNAALVLMLNKVRPCLWIHDATAVC